MRKTANLKKAFSLLLVIALVFANIAGINLIQKHQQTHAEEVSSVTINETNFPDENFRNYILTQFVKSLEDELTSTDLSRTEINCSEKNIADLTGIEYFTALETLDCSKNSNLSELDLSQNTALTTLNCSECSNNLTELDLSHNTALNELNCSYCSALTALDLSHNTALTTLWCYGCCNLTELDLSHNTALTTLDCSHCTTLTALDLSHNTALTTLNCFYCGKLTELDLSHNTALTELNCSECNLTSLKVSPSSTFSTFNCGYQEPAAAAYYIDNDGKYNIDMANIVGSDCISKVVKRSSADGYWLVWAYDEDSGIATYNGDGIPTDFSYTYNTGVVVNGENKNLVCKLEPLSLPDATFHFNNGNDNVVSSDVNGTVSHPTDPTKTGFTFNGWFTSSDGGITLSATPFDFSTKLTHNIDIYAKWSLYKEDSETKTIVKTNGDNSEGTLDYFVNQGNNVKIEEIDNSNSNYETLTSQIANALGIPVNTVNAKIIDIYCTNSSGEHLGSKTFTDDAEICIPIPEGWKADDIKAFYVDPDSAEELAFTIEEINAIKYACIPTNHFSHYALVNTAGSSLGSSPSTGTSSDSSSLKTGDNTFMIVCGLISILVCVGIVLVILKKKKK